MPRPQNSPRGLFRKRQVDITDASGNLTQITGNSTGLVLDKGLKVSNARTILANSTGFSLTAQAAKPSTRTAGYNWTVITNSTGVSGIAIRTTGTTWKFANVTSVLPS